MAVTEKMLVIAGLARSVYVQRQSQRILAGVAVAALLAIISAMLVGAMLIGGLYAAYFAFLSYGWTTNMAALFTFCLFALITAAFIAATLACLRRLRRIPQQFFGKSPAVNRATEAVEAFFDGLMAEEVK